MLNWVNDVSLKYAGQFSGDDDVLCTSEKDPLRLEEDFDSTPRDWQNYTISCEDVRQVNLVAFMNLSKMYYITIKSVLRWEV